LFKEKDFTFHDVQKSLQLLAKSPGGVSPNTLAILEKLGVKTAYHGVIGKDKDGDYWLKNSRFSINSKIIRKGKMSIAACILSHNRKYRTFLSKLNTHDNELFNNLDINFLNQCKFIHIAPFMLACEETLSKVIDLVKKIKAPLISFSPGVFYVNLGLKKLLPILNRTYILFINKSEIRKLTSKDIKKGSNILFKHGVKIIVCTDGAEGVWVTSKTSSFFTPSLKIKKVIDTTGAGDAFAAGMLYGLLKNKSLKWSAKFANKIAAKSISDFGLKWLKKL
jgi:ribokinase